MPDSHENIVTPVTAPALERHVRKLAGEIGERHVFRPRSLAAARDYIHHCWEAEGYAVETQEYEARDIPCANLSVTLPGTRLRGQVVLMGAHYDTVQDSPGADDNASGVAALLELSRRLAACRLRRTIRMVEQMDVEGFGSCGNHYECEAVCPKEIPVRFIADLNRDFLKAALTSREFRTIAPPHAGDE